MSNGEHLAGNLKNLRKFRAKRLRILPNLRKKCSHLWRCRDDSATQSPKTCQDFRKRSEDFHEPVALSRRQHHKMIRTLAGFPPTCAAIVSIAPQNGPNAPKQMADMWCYRRTSATNPTKRCKVSPRISMDAPGNRWFLPKSGGNPVHACEGSPQFWPLSRRSHQLPFTPRNTNAHSLQRRSSFCRFRATTRPCQSRPCATSRDNAQWRAVLLW